MFKLNILQGEKDIPGLTDTTVPRRLGPKRASRIRKLFNLSKEDDVRQYVVRKPLNKEGKNSKFLNSLVSFCHQQRGVQPSAVNEAYYSSRSRS